MAKPEKAQDVKEILFGVSSAEKRIPKYCNGVFMSKLKDGGIIMTFVAKEELEKDGKSYDESIVIERVFVDKDHAKKIVETLARLTDE